MKPISFFVLFFILLGIIQGCWGDSRKVSVTGTGIISITADSMEVFFSVERICESALEAQQNSSKAAEDIIDFLQHSNVTDLHTRDVILHPVYSYDKKSTPTLEGYLSRYEMSFIGPKEKAGELMDGIVSKGATRIHGARLEAHPRVKAMAEMECLSVAASTAVDRARAAVSSLGMCIEEVVRIREPQVVWVDSKTEFHGTRSPIVGSTLNIHATVSLDAHFSHHCHD